MSSQYGISFNQDSCIQCHGCEVACKSWRSVELGVAWRRVKHIWEGKYPQLRNTTVSIACMHCENPVCVQACPESAIKKIPENGVVEVDRDKCIGCQTCLEACPFQVPQFGKDGKMQKCDMCINTIDLNCRQATLCQHLSNRSPPFCQDYRRGEKEYGRVYAKDKYKIIQKAQYDISFLHIHMFPVLQFLLLLQLAGYHPGQILMLSYSIISILGSIFFVETLNCVLIGL